MTVGPYLSQLVKITPQYSEPDGTIHENVVWYSADTGGSALTASQLTTIQSNFDAGWESVWQSISASVWHYIGSNVYDYQSSTGLEVLNTSFTPVAGSGSGASQGAQVCALISLHEQDRYRGGHGRIYLPGVSATYMQDAKHITTSAAASLGTAFNSLQTRMLGLSAPEEGQVIVLRKRRSTSPFLANIVSVTGQTLIATQRRRLRKVPHH